MSAMKKKKFYDIATGILEAQDSYAKQRKRYLKKIEEKNLKTFLIECIWQIINIFEQFLFFHAKLFCMNMSIVKFGQGL